MTPSHLWLEAATMIHLSCDDAPDMLFAAVVDVRLAAISHVDVSVYLSLAEWVRLQLCHTS